MTVAALVDGPEPRVLAAASVAGQPAAAATTTTSPEPPAARLGDATAAMDAEVAADVSAFLAAVSRHDRIEAASRSDARPSLVRPAAGGRTGWFGERRGRASHVGMDIDGDTGDRIVAAGDGVVTWAGPAPAGYSGYGLMVLVRHSSTVETLYAHLSRVEVGTGQVVEAGQRLGAMGTTGNVTGSHLHFEVRLGGRPVDPEGWLTGG